MNGGGLTIAPIVRDGFSILAAERPDAIHVTFSGTGDMEATPVLGTYLKELHAEAVRLRVSEVAFDLNDLDFLNSSCFKAFVWWISIVGDMDDPDRYRVRFLSNPSLHWQRRSLEALENFAPEVVVVEPHT